MKILIHALGANMGGAMRHLVNFLPELGRQDPDREYVILARDSVARDLIVSKNIRIECVADPNASNWLRRVLADTISLPYKLKWEKFSLIVSLTNFGPVISPVPHIFFQTNSLYYCHYYLSKISGRKKIEELLRRRLAIETMKRASLIVTPSHAMSDMIKEACPELKNRNFKTLYHGFTKNDLGDPLNDKYQKMLAVNGFKILYPTHPAVHKGFEILFKALACLKQEGINFTLFTTIEHNDWPKVFERYKQQVRELGIEEQVMFMGRVPQGQMGALYEKCDLMLYPSLCESFGFSMIEAIGHGLPIVASATEVNREICGEGALYYAPTDFKQAAEMVKKAMMSQVSRKIIEGGQRRLESFDWSWKRYTREFIEIIEGFA